MYSSSPKQVHPHLFVSTIIIVKNDSVKKNRKLAIGDVSRAKVGPVGAVNGSTTTGFNSLDHFTFLPELYKSLPPTQESSPPP